MSTQPGNEHSQKAKAGKNLIQVGRDYTNTRTTNIWIPLVFTGIVIFGALAWAINLGFLRDSGNPQQPSSPAVLPK